MRYSNEERQTAYKSLKAIKGRSKKPVKIYALVNSVSRSGMSRRIEFFVAIDGDIMRIGYDIARIVNHHYNVDKGGLSVGGCGMDMIFSVLSNLNYAMASLDHPGKSYAEIKEIIQKSRKGDTRPELYYSWYYCDAGNYGRL